MRTAKEILEANNIVGMIDLMIPIINQARIEAIKECAENIKYFPDYSLNSKENDKQEKETKQSILSLIEQVK